MRRILPSLEASGESVGAETSSRTLLQMLDDWAMALPAQLVRDWTLVACAIVLMLNALPWDSSLDGGFSVQEPVRDSQGREWRIIPARYQSQMSENRPASSSTKVSATRQSNQIRGFVDRDLTPLVPTEFAGFDSIPGNHWVVQLAAFDSMGPLKAMVQRYQLAGAIGATLMLNGKEVHVLMLDVFPDKERALAASRKLPPGLDQINPWVRSVESIRKRLK